MEFDEWFAQDVEEQDTSQVVTVWRWEEPVSHSGPYRFGSYGGYDDERREAYSVLLGTLVELHNGDWLGEHHPTDGMDGLDSDYNWRVACPSEAKLDAWFAGVPDELFHHAGYAKVCYEVPAGSVMMGRSGKQVVVDLRAARIRELAAV